jgi:outer membrane autotransporter protein
VRPGAALGGIIALVMSVAGPAKAQSLADSLPLPPGQIIAGPVFRSNGTSVPSIATGADANSFIGSVPPTESFTPGAPSVVVRTSAPTQYVRVYTAGVTNPFGGFIAGSNATRGRDATQIRDVLALPFMPDSLSIVQVPAGTCMIVGQAAPILGNFAASPPAIPTSGPWGHGGAIQESLIGTSSAPGCADAQRLPIDNFGNRQPIGAAALSYRLRASDGNALAVASALDLATYPALFSDMDGIYNSLDLINIGDAAPLRAALVQLDGEIHADVATIGIEGARMFLGAVHDQIRAGREAAVSEERPVRQWLSVVGGGGGYGGDADAHGVSYSAGGIAAGMEHRFDQALLAGIAIGYTHAGFGTTSISGSGGINAVSAAVYSGYAPGPWYVDGALGFSREFGTLSRGIAFPGVARVANANLGTNALLSSVETGYRIPLDQRTAVTPFAAMQGIVVFQNGVAESGAGAVDLHVNAQTNGSARSVLGVELAHALPVGLASPLALTLRAGWGHEFASTARTATASFDGLPGAAFTVNGAPVPRDSAVIGIGATLSLPSVDLFLRYDGSLASAASTHSGTAGARFAF